MRAGRDDVLVLFRTWAEDRCLVRCELRFERLAATFRGRVVGASESQLHVLAEDKWTELVLSIRDDLEFAYGDMRDFPDEAEKFERGIIVFFPYDGDPADSDHIVLAEIKES